ncbi:MAG: LysR family transcriptional regulator [Myxococcaceae bacterium]|nr:LysR family transcriptional regulator [Myxococcaceae bacterium]
MEFERQRRVAGLWNWLPVFRAAAEYESLQRAALAMGVSPSAVSRTVRLLETALGFAVFDRLATGVRLTPRGERLLKATRDAMRWVDDSLDPLEAGDLRLAAVGPYLPALLARAAGPELTALRVVDADAVEQALLRGDAELVLGHHADDSPELSSVLVGELPLFIARGESEALHAPGLVIAEVSARHATRVDDAGALLELATRRRSSVVIPRALAPEGARLEPTSMQLPVWAVSRRPVASDGAASPQLTELTRALRALF